MFKFFHNFHLVTLSPWPLMGSLSLMIMLMGTVKNFHESVSLMMFIGMFMLLMVIYQWWRDVVRESTYQGMHSFKVILGLRLGMLLFILSELMFFVSFFWAYFHMYLSPSVEIGSIWPPLNLIVFNPYSMPLLNTLLLLSSGVSITYCHYSIMWGGSKKLLEFFSLTVILGMLFTYFQYLEYTESFFSFNDSVYGSIFFMATGFHGIHVLIGTLFIIVSFSRAYFSHFSLLHHFNFEAASWYWHFVDVIWLFLYLFIYWLSY